MKVLSSPGKIDVELLCPLTKHSSVKLHVTVNTMLRIEFVIFIFSQTFVVVAGVLVINMKLLSNYLQINFDCAKFKIILSDLTYTQQNLAV